MIEVKPPAEQFFDLDGSALDDGAIYVGASGANPETTPVAVYWDKDGLIPATQPIGTVNGYPYRLGAAAKFYTATKDYSITVRNKTGSLVTSATNTDSGVFDELLDVSSAAAIGYDNTVSGLAADTVQEAVDELKATADALDAEIAGLDLGTTGVINLFTNSAFLINQRGYVSGVATTGANQYTLDRIRVVVSGENLAFVASTFGNKITAPAGGAEQVIEGNSVTGGDYACTWAGSGSVKINGAVYVKEDTVSLPAGSNVTIAMYGEIEQILLTRPSMLSKFEYNYAKDLETCQRYYERILYSGAGLAALSGLLLTGSSNYFQWSFKKTKRAAPTVTLASGAWVGATPTISANIEGVVFSHASSYFHGNGAAGAIALSATSEL